MITGIIEGDVRARLAPVRSTIDLKRCRALLKFGKKLSWLQIKTFQKFMTEPSFPTLLKFKKKKKNANVYFFLLRVKGIRAIGQIFDFSFHRNLALLKKKVAFFEF